MSENQTFGVWSEWKTDEQGQFKDHLKEDIRARRNLFNNTLQYSTKRGQWLNPETVESMLSDSATPRSVPNHVLSDAFQSSADASVPQAWFKTNKAKIDRNRTPTDMARGSPADALHSRNVPHNQLPHSNNQPNQEELSQGFQSLQFRGNAAAAGYEEPLYLDPSFQPEHKLLREKVFDQAKSPSRSVAGKTATTISSQSHPPVEYRIIHSRLFKFGTVFKLEWFQPQGHDTRTSSTDMDPPKERYHKAHRRMMIVLDLESHCLVVPISTYGSRGCTKKGMKKSEVSHHAVIYGHGMKPWCHADEKRLGMTLQPIPVKLIEGQELDEWSRVRFDTIHTVPHNYKVKVIGAVPKDHHPVILRNLANFLLPTLSEQ